MRLTKHAQVRKQQRGLSSLSLDIIQRYGRCESAPGGVVRVSFGNKEYQRTVQEFKKILQTLDKAKGGCIIIGDEEILTVYKKTPRH